MPYSQVFQFGKPDVPEVRKNNADQKLLENGSGCQIAQETLPLLSKFPTTYRNHKENLIGV